MNVKKILRRLRIPRMIFYKIQFKKQKNKLPKILVNKNQQELIGLKNKYSGKRCFIIGNGPSLKVEDLNKLKDEYTFASNRINTLYSKTEWRPTFYSIQDELVLERLLNNLSDTISKSKIGFISLNNYEICNKSVEKQENIIWFPLIFCPPKKNRYAFSSDASKAVFEGLTITYSCIQMAVHMGFTEIYLLGVDHNYSIEIDDDGNIVKNDNSVKSYFDDALVSMNDINLPKIVEMTRAYISAEKHSNNNGYRIYNATRGGKLEVFERVDFDNLFV